MTNAGFAKTIRYPRRQITYPRGPGTNIGGGISNIYENVVEEAVWEWDDVRQYDFCQAYDLQFLGPTDTPSDAAQRRVVKDNCPNLIVLARMRHDLCWVDNYPWDNYGSFANQGRAWGNIVQLPTADMGEIPRNAVNDWASTQSYLQSVGWTQAANNALATANGAMLTCPYQMNFDDATRTWRVRQNMMSPNSDDWLELYTDNLAAQFPLTPDIDGFLISVEKAQFYYSLGDRHDDQFHLWIEGFGAGTAVSNGGASNKIEFAGTYGLADDEMNGFDVTITGGAGAGQTRRVIDWDATTKIATMNSNWSPAIDNTSQHIIKWDPEDNSPQWNAVNSINEAYDDPTTRFHQNVEFSFKLADALRQKVPDAFLMYSGNNLTVDTWRSSAYRADYRSGYIQENGGTDQDADNHWRDELTRMSRICDAIDFFDDVDAWDFSADWSNAMRIPGQWVKWENNPQTVPY